ncbi:pyrimidine reductase family protein [Microbacterium kyungheense]|uniref:Riboflavin biosynthesis pyrimidine reductase n=1 Tax=Microbacterium kyungheense TaxID=1263636 RepID=A0A543F0Z9_9MICO|nr:pyrimidine reductase family protein [Microbacterium kyungheense]TQM27501.1 riboflavin biosynthesis pyrimidine reductase [Microbacterium kyungheense]
MPTVSELFDAYALQGRDGTRVRMNFVSSADGAVTLGGRSGALGGKTDRALMQVLRTMADVVLVGAGTVRAEGYGGVRVGPDGVAWRRARGLDDQPALAVVSGGLQLDPGDPVFAEAVRRPVLVTTDATAAARGALFDPVATVLACGVDTVDLRETLDVFARRGWTQVLCEGGPHLFGALLADDLVDEVCVTIAPRFVGGEARRIVQGVAEADRRFALAGVVTDDEGFAFLRYSAG